MACPDRRARESRPTFSEKVKGCFVLPIDFANSMPYTGNSMRDKGCKPFIQEMNKAIG